jgi:small GTP-binding protein
MLPDPPKAVLIGDSGVGKTAIFRVIQRHPFNECASETVGGSCCTIDLTMPDNSHSRLMVWDTAGQEKYRQMIPMYFNRVSVLVVVYDITMPESFKTVQAWIELAHERAPSTCITFLIGNKADLEDKRVISTEAGLDLQERIGAVAFLEVSAKDGTRIDAFLDEIARALASRRQIRAEIEPPKERIVIGATDTKKEQPEGQGCC